MKRAKLRGLQRNAAAVLGTVGTVAAVPALEQALRDAEPPVRQHAAWALARVAPRAGNIGSTSAPAPERG